VIAPVDALSETRGNFKITFTEQGLIPRRFEGVLQVEPFEPGAAIDPHFCRFFIAGSFSVTGLSNLGSSGIGTNRLGPSLVLPSGPFPFCATGMRFIIGG
jgi:hypothetical protein